MRDFKIQVAWSIVVQSLSRAQLSATPWTATHRCPRPSLSPRVCVNSYPLSQWCYLTISSLIWQGFKLHSSYLTGKRIQDMKTLQLTFKQKLSTFLGFYVFERDVSLVSFCKAGFNKNEMRRNRKWESPKKTHVEVMCSYPSQSWEPNET